MFTITPSQSQSSSSSASSSSSQQQLLQQQQQQLLKQQQAIIQQAMLQQQAAALYHPALIAAMSQIEPMPNGNLPPRFDPTSCRSVYVGNIHPNVSEGLLAEVFATVGPLAGCKLIRKEKSSYGFVDYYDHRLAAAAIFTLNGKHIFSQAIKVNWAYASGQREDTTGHFSIFVGDLSSDVTDAALYAFFSIYQSCSDARVMWDQRTGRSRGFGFVSFRSQQDAERAIIEMTGKCLGSRAIRCNWATKSGTGSANQSEEASAAANSAMNSDVDVPSLLSNTVSRTNEMQQEAEPASKDAPENNPLCTTVYVGNLAHDITQTELHRQFHALGAGVIEEVRVQREKGFGFVRYRTHAEAALAIQAGNGKIIGGKSVKCSWGTKPTPPGTSSAPLPPPAPLPYQSLVTGGGLSQGYSAADLYAIQRQLALGAGALLPLPSQGINMGLTGMSVGSRSGYDSLQTGGGLGQAQML